MRIFFIYICCILGQRLKLREVNKLVKFLTVIVEVKGVTCKSKQQTGAVYLQIFLQKAVI